MQGTVIVVLLLIISCSAQKKEEESILEKIMKKLARAFEKSVIKAGNTCGLPSIDNVMRNLTLKEGDTARFQCDVDMRCMVSYIKWIHHEFDNNGTVRILRTAASKGNPYSFVVKSVSYPDEGFYSCIAGNTLGETVSSAYLEIAAATVDNLDTRIAFLTLVLMVGYAKL